jgi:hypothetical protein
VTLNLGYYKTILSKYPMHVSDFFLNEASAYHGSDHKFDEFSVAHIGTGYGLQRYGWGIYVTDDKAIARYYKTTKGLIYHVDIPPESEMLDWSKTILQQSPEVQAAIKRMNYAKIRQRAIENEVVAGYRNDVMTDTGQDVYEVMVSVLPIPKDFSKGEREDQKKVSLRMLRAGIAGIKYFADQYTDGGPSNFVIFDPRRIKIERTTTR